MALASLSSIAEFGRDGGLGYRIHIVPDDDGGVAAQLERRSFHTRSGEAHYLLAHTNRAGKATPRIAGSPISR